MKKKTQIGQQKSNINSGRDFKGRKCYSGAWYVLPFGCGKEILVKRLSNRRPGKELHGKLSGPQIKGLEMSGEPFS